MSVRGAQFVLEGSVIGTLAFGPGRAGLDDEALAVVQAMGVGIGVGIIFGEAGLVELVLGEGDSGWGVTSGPGVQSSRKAWEAPPMIKGGTRKLRGGQ